MSHHLRICLWLLYFLTPLLWYDRPISNQYRWYTCPASWYIVVTKVRTHAPLDIQRTHNVSIIVIHNFILTIPQNPRSLRWSWYLLFLSPSFPPILFPLLNHSKLRSTFIFYISTLFLIIHGTLRLIHALYINQQKRLVQTDNMQSSILTMAQ